MLAGGLEDCAMLAKICLGAYFWNFTNQTQRSVNGNLPMRCNLQRMLHVKFLQLRFGASPEAKAELNSGIIRFEHERESLTLDFEVDPNCEMIPMRVIG